MLPSTHENGKDAALDAMKKSKRWINGLLGPFIPVSGDMMLCVDDLDTLEFLRDCIQTIKQTNKKINTGQGHLDLLFNLDVF